MASHKAVRLEEEEWRPTATHGDIYEVSSLGRVRSKDRCVRHWRGGLSKRRGKLIVPCISKSGYAHVLLHKNGKRVMRHVHRLVAEAFVPKTVKGNQVNHKDLNKVNNCVSNLEWVTPKGNADHARRLGRSVLTY